MSETCTECRRSYRARITSYPAMGFDNLPQMILSPYLSPEDVYKFDTVRLALRRGDVAEAAKHSRVFELKPVTAE